MHHYTRLRRGRGFSRFLTILAIGLVTVVLTLSVGYGAHHASQQVFLPFIGDSHSDTGGNEDDDRQYVGNEIPPIVFVSRQIPEEGSVYWDEVKGMPGVGPYSRFQPAAPGKLIIREPSGKLRVLIDGSNPTATSKYLIDVNAPSVSYDGKRIVFAGLPAGDYEKKPMTNPGAWRIYTVNVDGTGLRQVTFSDQELDLSQFEPERKLRPYDDTDPTWLPDGRIVFSSTRWPGIAHYAGSRISNLYVINPDGSDLHRITSERNGADRPLVDPITGKIVFARWWRNHRTATNDMSTIYYDPDDPSKGYIQHQGLTGDRFDHVSGGLDRNAWIATAINPDGSELEMWSGFYRNQNYNHTYGGAFTADGDFIANYFPLINMTEAAGFGGIRRYERGPGVYEPIIGMTHRTGDLVRTDPPSYGIEKGTYAAEPDVLPDERIVLSWAPDIYQDYGLYIINPDGSGKQLLYDNEGTTELRAQAVVPRPTPPIIEDRFTNWPSLLPPGEDGPYDQDGTFTFNALNVYFNAPVDSEIVNAPPVGSAATLRFFLDHQRKSSGSFQHMDWPILLDEVPINPDGSVSNEAPAHLPLFEQIRSSDNTVPLTTGPGLADDGAAHVAGMNYAPDGSVQSCVGCHAGHSMIPVPENPEEAKWTNLATGAEVTVSSSRDPKNNEGLIDRQVLNGDVGDYWRSEPDNTTNQWVELTFPVPVTVRTVRLYNPRQDGDANATVKVHGTTVRLYSDAGGSQEVASQQTGELSVSGTDVHFNEVTARVVRIELGDVSGTIQNQKVASLAEVEVIAKAEAIR